MILEVGLNTASGQFYQVRQSSVVVMEEQVDAGSSHDTSSDKVSQVPTVAGVDDILNTLNQLIIEPISQRRMYDKYGEQITPRGILELPPPP